MPRERQVKGEGKCHGRRESIGGVLRSKSVRGMVASQSAARTGGYKNQECQSVLCHTDVKRGEK